MTMKRNLDELRTLVYPYEELSTITYGEGTQTRTEALAFSPNLVYFSITGLYNNLFGFVDELSFTIDDNISWATEGMGVDGIKSSPYPTVFDVSIGFKVIPNIEIKQDIKINQGYPYTYTYNYNFNDYGTPIVTDRKNVVKNLFKNSEIEDAEIMDRFLTEQNPIRSTFANMPNKTDLTPYLE
jgi:hypothetical protein